MKTDQLYTVMM